MYAKKISGDNIAKACSHNLRISVKNAKFVCKAVRGTGLKGTKKFLSDVLKTKKGISGKYYSKTTKEILNIIENGEKNAEFKNLDLDNTYIIHIAALEGTTMHRRRRKNKFGSKIKSAHLEIILKEKGKKAIKETKESKEEPKKSKEEKEQEEETKKKEQKREEVEKTKEEKLDKEKRGLKELEEEPKVEKIEKRKLKPEVREEEKKLEK